MLPEILASSYKRYKEDTNVFTTWLSHAAAACGYKTDAIRQESNTASKQGPSAQLPKTQRLKGKERKLAKQQGVTKENSKPSTEHVVPPLSPSTKYTVSTQDLLRQAEAIAKSTKKSIQMPVDVQRILERAIQARQRCAQWFEKTGVENQYSKEGHRHFIDVLQNALDLLKFRGVASSKPPGTNGTSNGTDPESVDTKILAKLQNKFEVLDVEDVDESFDITATDVLTMGSANNKDKGTVQKMPVNNIYEVEVDPIWEATFAIYCFFEDLHRIEESLNQTWRRYKSGELDLLSATAVTNAAIDLVHRTETEIHKSHEEVFMYGRSYDDLAMTIFYAESFSKGQDPHEVLANPDSLKITPFDEFIYLPVARTLMKFAQMKEIIQNCAWPPPVIPMRFSYISRPEYLELPGMAKKEEEDKVLSQLLLDLVMADDIKQKAKTMKDVSRAFPLMEDEFTNSVRSLWTTGDVTVQNVFASRIILNILDICAGAPIYQKALLDANERAGKTFQFHVDATGALDTGGGVRWFSKDQSLLLGLYDLMRFHISHSPIPFAKQKFLEANPGGGFMDDADVPEEAKAELDRRRLARGEDISPPSPEHVENAKKLNLQTIQPDPDLNFVFTHNPLYCGTLNLNLAVMTEEAGVALANHHLSIFATAHLYNALRQLNLTQIRWSVMERIMDIHVGPLFAGEVPTTVDTMVSRLALRVGINTSSRVFNEKKAWKIQSTDVSRTLRGFFENRDSIEKSLYQLEGHMQDHAQSLVKAKSGTASKKSKQLQRRQLTPFQFLAQLESYLPEILPDMTLDYITLTKTCNSFMKRLRNRIQRKLGVSHPSTSEDGDTNDHGFLFMVLVILQDSKEVARIYDRLPGRPRDREPFKGGPQLQVAAEALERFWTAKEMSIVTGTPAQVEV